jgi:WD repeat and SOF domain-containing protein 1
MVRGLCVAPQGDSFLSCGEDKTIKHWALGVSTEDLDEEPEPITTFQGASVFTGIDHHWSEPLFATCGEDVNVWNHARSEPIHTYSWGADSVTSVKFNPAEPCLLGSTGSDRSICLYDIRSEDPMRKVLLTMRSNCLAWNPMEPLNFTGVSSSSSSSSSSFLLFPFFFFVFTCLHEQIFACMPYYNHVITYQAALY